MAKTGPKPRTELTPNQAECIKLMVYTNMTDKEIHEQLEVNKNTITNWKKNELFQHELKKESQRYLSNLAPKAIRRMQDLINSKNDGVALNTCREILNKAGYKEVERIEQTTTVIDLEVQE